MQTTKTFECLNKIELCGTIGTVRTVTMSDSNRTLIRISLATSYAYKDKDGNAVIETTWHNAKIWDKDTNSDISAFKKGAIVKLSGRLHGYRYTDAAGADQTGYEVVAKKAEILGNIAENGCQAQID